MRLWAIVTSVLLALTCASAEAQVGNGGAERVAQETKLVVTVDSAGNVFVGMHLVAGDAAIVGALRAAVAAGHQAVWIACDRSRPHGEVVHLMELCKQAGMTKIALL